jgi:hypothetical protein
VEKGKAKALTSEHMEDKNAPLPEELVEEEGTPIVLRDDMLDEDIREAAETLIQWSVDILAESEDRLKGEIPLYTYNKINPDTGKNTLMEFAVNPEDDEDLALLQDLHEELESMLDGQDKPAKILEYLISLASPIVQNNE